MMELDEIEMKIASGNMTASQVFTQMKQHIDCANKNGWNGAVNAAADLMESGGGADAETIREQLESR